MSVSRGGSVRSVVRERPRTSATTSPDSSRHGDVVESRPPVPGTPHGRRGEGLTGRRRLQERDVGALGDRDALVLVARDREGGVGEREHQTPVRDVEAVRHVVAHAHRHHRTTGFVVLDDHAEGRGGEVALHHRFRRAFHVCNNN